MPITSEPQKVPDDREIYASHPLMGRRIPGFFRVIYCGWAAGIIALFVLCSTLSPDPRGLGTHEQLGLPPCGLQSMFGTPCPSCGMTTAWTLFSHGQWLRSAQVNLGGFLMALLAIPTCMSLLMASIQGRWQNWLPRPLLITGLFLMILLITFAQWIIRLQN